MIDVVVVFDQGRQRRHQRPSLDEGVEQRGHGAGHGDQDAGLDQEDAEFVPMRGVVGKNGIVEIILSHDQPGDAGAGIDQHAERDHPFDQRLRRDALRRLKAEGDGEQDDHAGRDDAGLESAARAEVAVELNVEREQQDERQDQLGADAKDEIEAHDESSPRSAAASPTRAAQEQHHADAGGEDHRRLAERVVAAVVGQHRGHDVRNVGLLDRVGDVARRNVLVDGRVGGAERRQNERAPDQNCAGTERDEQRQVAGAEPIASRSS